MNRDITPEERGALVRLKAINDLISEQSVYLVRLRKRKAELECDLKSSGLTVPA